MTWPTTNPMGAVQLMDQSRQAMQGPQAVSTPATLNAQNTFTTGLELRGDFNLSVADPQGGTLTLQRAFESAPTTWLDVKTYTVEAQDRGFEPEAEVLYRIGFKTGDFVAGPVAVRLSQ